MLSLIDPYWISFYTKGAEMSQDFQSKTRFSNRVNEYIQARPGYPQEILQVLKPYLYTSSPAVADIGSGTGKLSEVFLKRCTTFCVEPNQEMRAAAESLLGHYPSFKSLSGSAEETGIKSGLIDLIVAGQAFHWFDPEPTYQEFERILKKKGVIALIWNERNQDDPLMQAYEEALTNNCPEYAQSPKKGIDESAIAAFFKVEKPILEKLHHSQLLTLELLKSRALSSSYVPKEGPEHDQLMLDLEALFNKFQDNGEIKFEYETLIYIHKIEK